MGRHEFLSALQFIALPLPPPLGLADGNVCMARRLASDVTFNIMKAPVVGSPVMDELHRQGKERCFHRIDLLPVVTPATIHIMILIILSSARQVA